MPKRARAAIAAADTATTEADAPTVALIVGSGRELLEANAELLRNASGFFSAALQSEWKEATSRTIELPDSEPDEIRLLLSIISLQDFVKVGNVVQLRRLFSQFSMKSALIEHAEDMIIKTMQSVDYGDDECCEVLGFNGGTGEALCSLLMLAEDVGSAKLRDFILGEDSYIDPDVDMEEIGKIATGSRYTEVMKLLWPRVRAVVLSPAQLTANEMSELPSPETAAIVWPALTLSVNRKKCLDTIPQQVWGMLPPRSSKVNAAGKPEGDVFTDREKRDFIEAHIAQFAMP